MSKSKEPTRSHLEPLPFDLRVRDRNIASGAIDAGSLRKYLDALPDRGDQADLVTIPQPTFPLEHGAS